jgi:hypothetical protein
VYSYLFDEGITVPLGIIILIKFYKTVAGFYVSTPKLIGVTSTNSISPEV